MQVYKAELAVSAIISSWHRGNAERTDNQWLVPHGGENRCRNSSWKLSNPLQRLDFFTSNVAINRLVAHFLFGKPLDYDDMRESTKTAPRFCNFSNTRITTLALCKFERVGEEWQAATGGCIAASPPFAF